MIQRQQSMTFNRHRPGDSIRRFAQGVESGLGPGLSHPGDLPHRGRTSGRTHFVWPELHLWHSGHHFREAGGVAAISCKAGKFLKETQ